MRGPSCAFSVGRWTSENLSAPVVPGEAYGVEDAVDVVGMYARATKGFGTVGVGTRRGFRSGRVGGGRLVIGRTAVGPFSGTNE